MPETAGDDEGGRILKEVLKKALDIFYPRRCVICDRVLSLEQKFLCRECEMVLQYTGENYCLKCGRTVREEEEYCPACQGKEYAFESGRSLFLYDAVLRESIARFKYHGRQEYAAFYANAMYRELGDWIRALQPDALIPVPIHKKRYQKRGYNQAEVLAKELGKCMDIPVLSDYLVRVKNTLPQKELSKRERLENLSGAFSVRRGGGELYKKLNCVIIVDDIYTTGSTIEMCARILKEEGIRSIHFLCISTGQGF